MISRRGSALVLVLVMTLSLAGLAISAILLTSSSALVQRYYDKEKDFRLYALSAVAFVKSKVQRDTTVSIPGDTAYKALTASTITDATGATNSTIRVNAYAAYTGDTAGTYIPFLTILSQAYDTLGVRSVQRKDLQSEAFSRYAMFVDSFATTTATSAGVHFHGRAHGNRNWISAASPGTYYYDTLSVVGSVSGTSTYYQNGVAVTGAARIHWPTTSSLSALPTLANAGNLSFAQVSSAGAIAAFSGGTNVGGDASGSFTTHGGTRLRFKPVDVNNNGTYDAAEGFFELFDLASGIDTSALRVDPVSAATGSETGTPSSSQTTVLNQCGLMVTIAGRREFFPVARFREPWVNQRVMLSTAPTVTAADTAVMDRGNSAAVSKILGYGVGYSRCFPVGSPYLMLAERFVTAGGTCTVTTSTSVTPYGWGASGAGAGGCTAGQQYGGQDTTFTASVTRCFHSGTAGQCSGDQVSLGSWRTFGGTNTASPPATVLQAVEIPYLWPISITYNAASRGVIYASGTGPLFVSDTVRGFVTLYAHGRIVLINDVVYDKDPLDSAAKCRNMLGIIADTNVKVASNALNFPRKDPTGTYRFLGTPNYTLDAIVLALSTSNANIRAHGTFTVEDSSTNVTMAITCNGSATAGGCLNHTGGAIMKIFHQSNDGSGHGLIRNLTQDPCQAQSANRRPPYFPLTGRYVDYKSYDVDPRYTGTWDLIKTYLARLRGNNRAVP